MASEPMENSLCQSQKQGVTFCFTWTISNFSFSSEMRDILISSLFSSGAKDKWCLQMKPCEKINAHPNEYVSLFIVLLNSPKCEVTAEYKFSVLDADGEKCLTVSDQPQKFKKKDSHGFTKFVRRDFLLDNNYELLQDDRLTIFCEVRIIEDSVTTSSKNTTNVLENRLVKGLEGLLENSHCTDCSLYVADKEFKAHKAILAARCPTFHTIFVNKPTEEKESCVTIKDMKPDIFKEILHFIYTGKAPNLNNMVYDLLVAADRFQLKRLALMCESTICRKLSVETAAEIWTFANRERRYLLKAQVLKFITFNKDDVMEASSWKSLMQHHPHLMKEVVFSTLSRGSVFLEPPLKRKKTD